VEVGNNIIVTDMGLPSRRTTFEIMNALISDTLPDQYVAEILKCVARGTNVAEEVEIQMQCHKIAINITEKFPQIVLQNISLFDLVPVFMKVLPATVIDVDKQANAEIIASAQEVIKAIENQLYDYKYLGKSATFTAINSLINAGFGGLNSKRLYENVTQGLGEKECQEQAIKILTGFWKLWDVKIQNNKAHREIAEKGMSGLETLVEVLPTKLRKSQQTTFITQALTFVRFVEVSLQKLEKHKKDLELKPNSVFSTYVANLKKGPLANKYNEISK